MISLNIDFAAEFIRQKDIEKISEEVFANFEKIKNKTGKGNDFLGWVTLPDHKNSKCIARINKLAKEIRRKSELLVVVGIGGSYLGTRAVVEALQSPFAHFENGDHPRIVYAGHHLDGHYLNELIKILHHKSYSIVVISKSGTTTEPAIAFRILRQHLEQKYGMDEARERVIAITDQSQGALRQAVEDQGYESFYIPDNVGGRYSVLTPVGLFPIAVAGFDIERLMEGDSDMKERIFAKTSLLDNPALMYVAIRNILYRNGKNIEVMINYQPDLYYFIEWWKQLFGESEGKEEKGIFPAGVNFTTDLHSLGQYLQEGHRLFFETILNVEKPKSDIVLSKNQENLDGLNYLNGKSLHHINQKAAEGTALAHKTGNIPVIQFDIPEINEYYLGQLIYLFEMACGISGHMLEVNPFDQPGVEMYKKNMFRLLKKPGY